MLQFLEYLMIAVLCVVSVAVIVGFIVYCGLDKRRFRMDRQLAGVLPLLKKYLQLIEQLSGEGVLGSEEVGEACREFLSTKKLTKRLNALSVLSSNYRLLSCRLGVEFTAEQMEIYQKAQDLRELLRDFFVAYPSIAKEYNEKLEKPVSQFCGKLMGFRPAPDMSGLAYL